MTVLLDVPVRTWLAELCGDVRSVGISTTIAATAAVLRGSFPGDGADRIIYATAIEDGWQLVTRDRRMSDHPQPRQITAR